MNNKEILFIGGALNETTDIRDYRLKLPKCKQQFPAEYSLKMCDVKNQGSVGSCVAHALAATVEYHNKVQDNILDKVSVGFIYGNRRNSLWKGSGMYVREALANLKNYGDVFLDDFKENQEAPKIIDLFEERFDSLEQKAYPNRITKYFRVKSDDDIKYAIMNYGPVVFSVKWRTGVKIDENNVLTFDPKSKASGGHCMVIYGWTEDGWKVQNSWGTGFGKNGRVLLDYSVKKTEAWCITDDVSGKARDEIVKPNFAKWFAKILNWICNLFRKKGK